MNPGERLAIAPHAKDLGGGFTVRRLLPAAARRSVGPFVFVDHMGPVDAPPGANHDVRPHPHIGLATLTWLFEGAFMHRDSTGAVQRIEPGAVNWMTAGRGIVHSERAPEDLRERPRRTHGLQLWAALPSEQEAGEPGFQHVPAAQIPELEVGGARVKLAVGALYGAHSPVHAASETLFAEVSLQAGDAFPLPPVPELAVYGIAGRYALDGEPQPEGRLVVLMPGEEPLLSADGDARVVLIGGAPLGPRFVWWNFVASSREAVARAAADWAAATGDAPPPGSRFPPVPGETEFIPLPPGAPVVGAGD